MTLHVYFPHEEHRWRWISLPPVMFEELTEESSSFVYLINLLCWNKPKWKWHQFQRICNRSNLKGATSSRACYFVSRRVSETPARAKRAWILCLVWVHVYVFEWLCLRRFVATKKLNSTTNKESKQVLFLFSLLIHSFDIGRSFLSKGMCTY